MRWAMVALCLTGCGASLENAASDDGARSTLREVTSGVLPGETCGELSWPVQAPLSSPFGRRDGRAHQGIDLAAPEGTEVHAACDGVVRYADDKLRGYGRLVIVEHAGGLSTFYAHNQALLVAAGERVSRGQVLARSGATGHVTAPHVHFEVRQDGRAIDPLTRLAPLGLARETAPMRYAAGRP